MSVRKIKIENMGHIQTEHNRFRLTQSPANHRQPFVCSQPMRGQGWGMKCFGGGDSSAAKLPGWGETKRHRSNCSISLVACI